MLEDKPIDDPSDPETEEEEEEEAECDPVELKKSRNKALTEFRFRVEQAILGHYLLVKRSKRNPPNENIINDELSIKLWGVPLLPKEGHEGTDIVLMKFLKAKRYKVHEAFTLLRRTLKWRAEFRPDENLEELRPEIDSLWFSSGKDEEGRPLCYTMLGNESHKKLLSAGDDQKCRDYLRWRVLSVEKAIQNLNFRPGGTDSIIQIIDLKNATGPAKKEVRLIYNKMMTLVHDHYPGLVYKNLIINVPSWFLALNTLNLRLITQKSRNKFIFVKPSKVTETLLKYATAENILVQYGGLKRENDTEFSTDDKVLEVNIRANATGYIEIPTLEAGVTVTWDVTVVGYEVAYREEFIPDDDCSYKILLQDKKMGESIRNSFYIREPGKIVITVVNGSYAKKKAFYRYKSRPIVPMFMFINK
ncbi:hypothetical protein ABFS83_04G041400 [Erythranthe nasuta]